MDELQLQALKSEVERILGRKILSTSDCRYLYNDLSKNQRRISFNTLRRVYGLLRSSHQPSSYTLNILANYCGYDTIHDFIHSHHSITEKDQLFYPEDEVLNLLVNFYTETKANTSCEETFTGLTLQTIRFIDRHALLSQKFQSKISQSINGRLYYYERCIHFDRLNSYYGDGFRYYMHNVKDAGSVLFGYYLLSLNSVLTNDEAALEKYYRLAMQVNEEESGLSRSLSFKPVIQLLHHYHFRKEWKIDALFVKDLATALQADKKNHADYFRFSIHLADAFVLCREYEEGLYLVYQIKKARNKGTLNENDLRLFELIPLLEACCLNQIGHEAKAKECVEMINPSSFHFLHHRYLTIIYLTLKQQFQKNHTEQKQVASLIKETGFTMLPQLILDLPTPKNINSTRFILKPIDVEKINLVKEHTT